MVSIIFEKVIYFLTIFLVFVGLCIHLSFDVFKFFLICHMFQVRVGILQSYSLSHNNGRNLYILVGHIDHSVLLCCILRAFHFLAQSISLDLFGVDFITFYFEI